MVVPAFPLLGADESESALGLLGAASSQGRAHTHPAGTGLREPWGTKGQCSSWSERSREKTKYPGPRAEELTYVKSRDTDEMLRRTLVLGGTDQTGRVGGGQK